MRHPGTFLLWLVRGFALLVVLALVLAGAFAHAQAVEPDTSLSGALRSLASRASVVFAGQVVRVERKGGVVEVEFRVDQMVLGAAAGSYTVREWAGLWPPGQHRYVPGQRVMIFLRAPSSTGLSSPVDGMEGIVPLVMRGADASAVLDVRRLQARVARAKGSALPAMQSAGMRFADAAAVVVNWRRASAVEPACVPLGDPADASTESAARELPFAISAPRHSASLSVMQPAEQSYGVQ